MSPARGVKYICALAAIAACLGLSAGAFAQESAPPSLDPMTWGKPTNDLPNPYGPGENFGTLPEGRTWGADSGVSVDAKGNVWDAERCGGSCKDSPLNPILEFDPSGKLINSFGGGMFVQPHGITVDKDGNIWVTDQLADGKRGMAATKFTPDGKVLMTLGTPGVPGDGNNQFNQPSAVAVAPNGDIFVADGHGGKSNARIVKFDKDGKFLMTWGKLGDGPGDFNIPHAAVFDSQGRLFIGDRGNRRIQIFDQQGKFLAQWTQFSRPSGIFIDKNDVMYVADSESGSSDADHKLWKRGIRIGSAKDGTVKYLIPDPNTDPNAKGTQAAEGVAADAKGTVYGAEVGPKDLKRYVLTGK